MKTSRKRSLQNPWHSIPPKPPFVLQSDAAFVRAFNRRRSAASRIDDSLLPEPCFGRRDAPVVVLLLNPGIGTQERRHHRRAAFREALRKDLSRGKPTHHFHLVDPTRGPGFRWWHRKCRQLIADVGEEAVSRNLLCIEFSPYHSRTFAHPFLRLPSQEYGFALLRAAIKRNAVVVCMRGLSQWLGAVPDLDQYPNLLLPRSTRSATLSPRNIPHYRRLVSALLNDA